MKKNDLKKILLLLLLSGACLISSACQTAPDSGKNETESSQQVDQSSISEKSRAKDDSSGKAEESKSADDSSKVAEKSNPASSAAENQEAAQRKSEIECLLLKKQELKDEGYFSKSNTSYINTYFYNDAVIKDFNSDGHYEMIVEYIVPFSHYSSEQYDPEKETFMSADNNYKDVRVLEIYTVRNNQAVGSGYLDQIRQVFSGAQVLPKYPIPSFTTICYDNTSHDFMIAAQSVMVQHTMRYNTYFYQLDSEGKAQQIHSLLRLNSEDAEDKYKVDQNDVDEALFKSTEKQIYDNQMPVSLEGKDNKSELRTAEDFIRHFKNGKSKKSVDLSEKGSSETLSDGISLSSADETNGLISVVWTSSNPEIAQVDQKGVVTAVAQGSCTITAVLEGKNVAMEEYDISVEDDSGLVSEEGVRLSEERWQMQKQEFQTLSAYCTEHCPVASSYVNRKDVTLLKSVYHIIDIDGDDHLELLVGPIGFADNADNYNDKDKDPYFCIYRIEGDTVIKQSLGDFQATRGNHYQFMVVPEKENGKVVGVKGIQFVNYTTPGYAFQPNDIITHKFQWVRSYGLETQASYSFEVKGSFADLSYDYYDTTNGGQTQYSKEEMNQLLRERHNMQLSTVANSDFRLVPIDENGNNFLSGRSGSYSDYLFYDSDTRLLTFEDIEAMLRRNNCEDDESRKKYLELAINETAAIYGHLFQTDYMKQYFESKAWYTASGWFEKYMSEHNKYSQLSEIEQANVATIEAYLKALEL